MLPLKVRIKHFTWSHFISTIAGGGVGTLLGALPYTGFWVKVIGMIVFLFNFGELCLFTSLMCARFYLFPRHFIRSLLHPVEATFIPAFFLSWANMIMCTASYATPHVGPWLLVLLRVLFWVYFGVTIIQAFLQFVWLYCYDERSIKDVTPVWLLLIFPVMLCGSISNTIAPHQPQQSAVQLVFAGITCQAVGFHVSLFMYGLIVNKFSMYGPPEPSGRPGMFITVGPLAFTGLAFVGLGRTAEEKFPEYFITYGWRSFQTHWSLVWNCILGDLLLVLRCGAYLRNYWGRTARHEIQDWMVWHSIPKCWICNSHHPNRGESIEPCYQVGRHNYGTLYCWCLRIRVSVLH